MLFTIFLHFGNPRFQNFVNAIPKKFFAQSSRNFLTAMWMMLRKNIENSFLYVNYFNTKKNVWNIRNCLKKFTLRLKYHQIHSRKKKVSPHYFLKIIFTYLFITHRHNYWVKRMLLMSLIRTVSIFRCESTLNRTSRVDKMLFNTWWFGRSGVTTPGQSSLDFHDHIGHLVGQTSPETPQELPAESQIEAGAHTITVSCDPLSRDER